MNHSLAPAPKRSGRALASTALAGLLAGGITMVGSPAAQAATPPAFPNNLVVFPQRDFVTVEGYQGRIGQVATVTVTRNGVQTGTATGTVAAGDVAFEINHPGGSCWDGVTPNIKPGDVVRISFPGGASDTTTVQTPEVTAQADNTGFQKVGSADLIVRGTKSADIPMTRMEQRIVAPDLKDTAVGRRDVRAMSNDQRPGPYTSDLVQDSTRTKWTATYHFVSGGGVTTAQATAMRDIAAAGQMRMLSWQVADGAGNRQGLTISEFGEVGGPGFGGCPTGPETVGPNAPSNVSATAGTGSVSATWSPATIIPDGSPVTGYQVKAVNTVNNVGTTVEVPLCTTGCSATIPNLQSGVPYQIEVRAQSAAGLGKKGVAASTVSPKASTVVAPNAPTVVTATAGSTADLAVDASVSWTAPAQPASVTVEAWRITAYDATTLARVKRVFLDEPAAPADASRSRSVGFTSARSVIFRVQAISADEAGTMSPLSAASAAVTAQ